MTTLRARVVTVTAVFGTIVLAAMVLGQDKGHSDDPRVQTQMLIITRPQGKETVSPSTGAVDTAGTAENGFCATDVRVKIYDEPQTTVSDQPDSTAVSAGAATEPGCSWHKEGVTKAGGNEMGTWANECVVWAKYPGDANYSEWTSSLFRGQSPPGFGFVPAQPSVTLKILQPQGKRWPVRVANLTDAKGKVRVTGTITPKAAEVKAKIVVPTGAPLEIPLTAPTGATAATVAHHPAMGKTRWVIDELPDAPCSNGPVCPRSFVVVWYRLEGATSFAQDWRGVGFEGLAVKQ